MNNPGAERSASWCYEHRDVCVLATKRCHLSIKPMVLRGAHDILGT
jgi:hypothetical protein